MLGGDTAALHRLDARQLADSALRYYYLSARLGYVDTSDYYPVRQLEAFRQQPCNPSFVPFDSHPRGAFLPPDYLANLKANWMTRFDVKYCDVLDRSESVAKSIGKQLAGLQEDPLFGAELPEGSEAYRFTWLRPSLPPLMVRVESNGFQHQLCWKLGTNIDHYRDACQLSDSGSRLLTDGEWDEVKALMTEARLDSLENHIERSFHDDARWFVEHLDGSRFKALYLTNPPESLITACLYLVRLTGEKIPLWY